MSENKQVPGPCTKQFGVLMGVGWWPSGAFGWACVLGGSLGTGGCKQSEWQSSLAVT